MYWTLSRHHTQKCLCIFRLVKEEYNTLAWLCSCSSKVKKMILRQDPQWGVTKNRNQENILFLIHLIIKKEKHCHSQTKFLWFFNRHTFSFWIFPANDEWVPTCWNKEGLNRIRRFAFCRSQCFWKINIHYILTQHRSYMYFSHRTNKLTKLPYYIKLICCQEGTWCVLVILFWVWLYRPRKPHFT